MARWGMVPAAGVAALMLVAHPAGAGDKDFFDPDEFIHLYAGPHLTYGGVTHTIGRHTFEADNLSGPLGWRAGFTDTLRVNPFLAIEAQPLEVYGFHLGTVRTFDRCDGGGPCSAPSSPSYGGFGVRSSMALKAGLPLRYLQPYVGVGIGVEALNLAGNDPTTGSTLNVIDTSFYFPYLAGVAFFLSRTTRIVVDYQLVLKDHFGANDDAKAPASLRFRDLQSHSLSFGVAFSDDAFKRDRDRTALPTALLFGLTGGALIIGVAYGAATLGHGK